VLGDIKGGCLRLVYGYYMAGIRAKITVYKGVATSLRGVSVQFSVEYTLLAYFTT